MRKLLPITYLQLLFSLTSPIPVLAQVGLLPDSGLSEVIKGDKSGVYAPGLFTRPLLSEQNPVDSHRGGDGRGKSLSGEHWRTMTADY